MPPALPATDLLFSGPLVVAILISAAAGLVSFFSPCCLPLVPGYLSYVAGLAGAENRAETREQVPVGAGVSANEAPESQVARQSARGRTLLGGALFVAGFAAVFTSYGAAFGAVGSLLLEHQQTLIRILGVITILLGLMFTGLLWRIPLAGRSFRLDYRPRAGLIGAPLVGVMFGLGWTPCIGPTLGVILTLATSSGSAGRGAVLTFAYSVGLGIPFLIAAFSVSAVMRHFGWARRHARSVMMVGGILLILLGVLQVTGVWFELMTRLQVLVLNWQSPL
jgi:cytochrome c-type biogenesis protein